MIVYTRLDRAIKPAQYFRNNRSDITSAAGKAKKAGQMRLPFPRNLRAAALFPHPSP